MTEPTSNDNIADATEVVITDATGPLLVNGGSYTSEWVPNADLTVEEGEPGDGFRSAWWKYTPTADGEATFDARNSQADPEGSVDVIVGVYTPPATNESQVCVGLGWISFVSSDPSFGCPVGVTAGTDYLIRVAALSADHPVDYRLAVQGPDSAASGDGGTGDGDGEVQDAVPPSSSGIQEVFTRLPGPSNSGIRRVATDPELLYSEANKLKKGGTIAGGQGILRLGTFVAQNQTTLRYERFDENSEAAVPPVMLVRSIDTDAEDATDQQANFYANAAVKLEYVQAANSENALNAAVALLNARVRPDLGEYGVLSF